jgi:hypothetical protein
MSVRVLRSPNALVAIALSIATLASLGPHLVMVGYKVAGARPPAALVFFCLLHHTGQRPSTALAARTRPLVRTP